MTQKELHGNSSSRVCKNRKMQSLADVLALLIFGLVLFLNVNNFVNSATIIVFWVVKN